MNEKETIKVPLTEKEISDIALGYNWNPDMSYETFVQQNPELSMKKGYDLYMIIEDRYLEKAVEFI